MKVLLRDDVAGVGRRGDIVKVAGGFARNFLLPEGRAIVASDGIEGQAEQMRRGRDLREAQDRRRREAQADHPGRRGDPDLRSGRRRRATLRLHRSGRRRRSHQGGQGGRGGPQARGPARAHQGDGVPRRDGGPVPRCDRRRDPRGQPPAEAGRGRQRPASRVGRGGHTRPASCRPCRCSALGRPRSYTAFPQADAHVPVVTHTVVRVTHSCPQQVRSDGPQPRTVRVGGPWSTPSTNPRPTGRPRCPPRRRARVPPHDLEAEESLLGAMLLSNDAASVGDRDVLGGRLLQAGPRPHLRGHPCPHGAGRGRSTP